MINISPLQNTIYTNRHTGNYSVVDEKGKFVKSFDNDFNAGQFIRHRSGYKVLDDKGQNVDVSV